ncbi:MAG: hypothetical protein NC230_04750 [Bacteroides sp.]|nr:hypothetical protein [Bacteroides sp.]
MTYEEAFDSIKTIPNMKGVQGTEISGSNDFASLGITDGQLILWDNETAKETEPYGNRIYALMGQLPVSEMVQGRMYGNSIFAIFAKPVSPDKNRIIILSDSAEGGFTGALIGNINDINLSALRGALIKPIEGGGMGVYYNVLNF